MWKEGQNRRSIGIWCRTLIKVFGNKLIYEIYVSWLRAIIDMRCFPQKNKEVHLQLYVLCYYMMDKGCDDTKLGRWSWISVRGNCGVRTLCVISYQPVKGNKKGKSGIYTKVIWPLFFQKRALRRPATPLVTDAVRRRTWGVYIHHWCRSRTTTK